MEKKSFMDESLLVESLAFQVNATANALRNGFSQFLKPYSLAPEQFATMVMLKENPNITQTEIAKKLFKDKTTITRMIDSLIKKDFITKEQVKDDRRAYHIKLSTKGLNIIEEVSQLVEPVINAQKAIFSENEIKKFLEMLKKLQDFKFELN